jgi:ribose 5-phosphate isomerase B
MHVYFASDHAGFALKGALIEFVRTLGHEVEDLGAHSLDTNDDYPDFVLPLAQRVAADVGSFGVVLGASGQGEAMAANRIKGVRAAVCYGEPLVDQTDAAGNVLNLIQSVRAHNNANILSIGARFMTNESAKNMVKIFLETPFSGDERHARRIAKLDT